MENDSSDGVLQYQQRQIEAFDASLIIKKQKKIFLLFWCMSIIYIEKTHIFIISNK